VLELAQGNWIDQHLNALVLGPTGSGNRSSLVRLASLLVAQIIPSATSVLPACWSNWRQSHLDGSFPTRLTSLAKIDCLSSMIGCAIPSLLPKPVTCSKFSMTASDDASTLVASQVPGTSVPKIP